MDDILEIAKWLDSIMVYDEGVALYVKYSHNDSLKRILPGNEKRYAGKLQYELRKLCASRPRQNITAARPIKVSALKPVEEKEEDIPDDESEPAPFMVQPTVDMPMVIRRIIAQFSDLYKSRSIAHNSLKTIPPDNRSENVEFRRIIVEKIREYSLRMDELQHYQTEFNTKSIVPDEAVVFPQKTKVNRPPESENLDALMREPVNLGKSISRDNNILNFQAPTRQPAPKPMPAGPKRTALLARIKTKKTDYAKLTSRIDGINKILGTPSTPDKE